MAEEKDVFSRNSDFLDSKSDSILFKNKQNLLGQQDSEHTSQISRLKSNWDGLVVWWETKTCFAF